MQVFGTGVALHGGPLPYGASFLIFSDYMRPPMRLAAMMRLQVVYVFTHDSIFLGEEGRTHQPVEQLPGLRLVPNLEVLRPADPLEVAMAWTLALERRDGPTALVLTRQDLPPLRRPSGFSPEAMRRGGYVLSDAPVPDRPHAGGRPPPPAPLPLFPRRPHGPPAPPAPRMLSAG